MTAEKRMGRKGEIGRDGVWAPDVVFQLPSFGLTGRDLYSPKRLNPNLTRAASAASKSITVGVSALVAYCIGFIG